ncbi:hypothetical protein PC121_g20242 [Phytophthora cactorum]|nr:hypothetical protein PC120_g20982 [Phytophthora cactorum]KAG3047144.1 hypothetical protein PC121_g20242 [Phytophthora cactorum]KAG4042135.1 hypothetical protein PC123_g22364 [Phytophthora cactorum]
MLRCWWTAFRVTYEEYLQDLTLRTLSSMRRYLDAFFEAIVAIGNRCYAFGEGGYSIALIDLSLCLYVPMTVFDLLEFVWSGTKGEIIAMVVLNSVLDWTSWLLPLSLAMLGAGAFSHGWRRCASKRTLWKLFLSGLTYSAMDSVQKNASTREQAVKASWERLRSSEEEAPPSVPTGDLEARPVDPTLKDGDVYYLNDEESRAGLPADFSSAGVSLSARSAISEMGPNAPFAEDGERLVGRLLRVREYQCPSRRSFSRSYPDCFGGSL